jgi:hypothetical protein
MWRTAPSLQSGERNGQLHDQGEEDLNPLSSCLARLLTEAKQRLGPLLQGIGRQIRPQIPISVAETLDVGMSRFRGECHR